MSLSEEEKMLQYKIGIALGCCLIFLSACGGNNVLQLSDTQASQIDIAIALSINAMNDNQNYLAITTLQNSTWVSMNHHETMSCNGIKLDYDPDGTGFTTNDFPLATPITPISCFYISGSHQAQFSFTPPSPPQVSSPTANAILNHTQPLTITFTKVQGTNIRAIPSNDAGGGRIVMGKGANAADNGSLTLNVKDMHAGSGTLQVQRLIDTYIEHSGFRSIELTIDTTTTIPVVWS